MQKRVRFRTGVPHTARKNELTVTYPTKRAPLFPERLSLWENPVRLCATVHKRTILCHALIQVHVRLISVPSIHLHRPLEKPCARGKTMRLARPVL
ncbi:MAG: hypothetical protein E7E28_05205, partial [Negativicoccus succinicivorans]|nr:hypothetical protein [Negativicoccus succinicivorans]